MKFTKPKLYTNISKEDQKAYQILVKGNIPFLHMGADCERKTPYLKYEDKFFDGIKDIEGFVRDYNEF